MTPKAQRIAIGEACGLSRESLGPDFDKLPNYLSDLNAMHEAEKSLTNNQCAVYLAAIADQLPLTGVESWAFKATASQRAEAFLRTLNLWTE